MIPMELMSTRLAREGPCGPLMWPTAARHKARERMKPRLTGAKGAKALRSLPASSRCHWQQAPYQATCLYDACESLSEVLFNSREGLAEMGRRSVLKQNSRAQRYRSS